MFCILKGSHNFSQSLAGSKTQRRGAEVLDMSTIFYLKKESKTLNTGRSFSIYHVLGDSGNHVTFTFSKPNREISDLEKNVKSGITQEI